MTAPSAATGAAAVLLDAVAEVVRQAVREALAESARHPTAADDGDELLNLPRAAEIAGVSLDTLRRAHQVGDLARVQIGRRGVRVKRADLRAWVEARRVPSRCEAPRLRAAGGGR